MNNNIKSFLYIISSVVLFTACETTDKPKEIVKPPLAKEEPPVTEIEFTVGNNYPHDVTSFTEGFLFHENKLYESTGASPGLPQTRSLFGVVDLKTGKIDVKAEIDKSVYFGEGIVILKGKVFQVTWKNQTGFVYDAKNFKNIGKFTYTNTEGWGLTTDGKNLIMSDGTSYLTYLDPDSFTVKKVLAVKESGYDLININELEYIKGFIYANIWLTNTIVKIDPITGAVVGKMDLSKLTESIKIKNPSALEMNGIAYDSVSNKFLITGKLWPTIYELQFPL